jgi:hypothetical protein
MRHRLAVLVVFALLAIRLWPRPSELAASRPVPTHPARIAPLPKVALPPAADADASTFDDFMDQLALDPSPNDCGVRHIVLVGGDTRIALMRDGVPIDPTTQGLSLADADHIHLEFTGEDGVDRRDMPSWANPPLWLLMHLTNPCDAPRAIEGYWDRTPGGSPLHVVLEQCRFAGRGRVEVLEDFREAHEAVAACGRTSTPECDVDRFLLAEYRIALDRFDAAGCPPFGDDEPLPPRSCELGVTALALTVAREDADDACADEPEVVDGALTRCGLQVLRVDQLVEALERCEGITSTDP